MARHTFFCIDAHTCGNPVRLVAGGGPLLAGATMSEQRQDFLARLRLDPHGADVRAARPRRDVGLDPLPADARRIATSAILFIEVSRLPADVRPRHHRHGDDGDRERAGDAARAGRARARRAGRAGRGASYEQQGPLRRERAHHQRAVAISPRPTCAIDVPGHRRARASTSPMAAISTPSSSRRRTIAGLERLSAGDDPAPVADRAPAAERGDHSRCIRRTRRSAASATSCGPASRATRAPMPATPCSTATRRSTARPCGTGTSARMAQLAGRGQARASATNSSTRASSAACSTAASRRRRKVGDHDGDRARRSPAGRACTATTRSSSTTAIRSRTGFRWLRRLGEPSNLFRYTRVSTTVAENLASRILEHLRARGPAKAKDIATALGVDRTTINQLLHGPLRGQVKQDKNYAGRSPRRPRRRRRILSSRRRANTWRSLFAYYLACLSQDDDNGVSVLAQSRHDLDYVELPSWPFDGFSLNNDSDSLRKLIGRQRREARKKVLWLGYPVMVRQVRTRSGWEGTKWSSLCCSGHRTPSPANLRSCRNPSSIHEPFAVPVRRTTFSRRWRFLRRSWGSMQAAFRRWTNWWPDCAIFALNGSGKRRWCRRRFGRSATFAVWQSPAFTMPP